MGVKGLWSLLDPTGKPVTLESLEGKILAVDVSIWLHHLMHGMRDRQGEAVTNAHLMGLFTRVCKLLFYKIRPVFVFDGGVPELKKQTLAARRQVRSDANDRSEEVTKKILEGLLKRHAVNTVLSGPSTSSASGSQITTGKQRKADMFELPPLPKTEDIQDRAAVEIDRALDMRSTYLDIFTEEFQDPDDIDPDSEDFKSLPAEMRYELLNELKERRKNRRGLGYQDMPEETEDFSKFQLARMMRKSKLTTKLDHVRKEINAQASGAMVQGLTGYDMDENVEARRLVSSDTSHYILIKGLNKKSQGETKAKLLAGLKDEEEPKPEPQKTTTAVTESDLKKAISEAQIPESKTPDLPPILLLDEIFSKDSDDIFIEESKSYPPTRSERTEVSKSKSKPESTRTKPKVVTIDSDYESDSVHVDDGPQVETKELDSPLVQTSESGQPTGDFSSAGGFILEDTDSESNDDNHSAGKEKKKEEEGQGVTVGWKSRDCSSVRATYEQESSEDERDEESTVEETSKQREDENEICLSEDQSEMDDDERVSNEISKSAELSGVSVQNTFEDSEVPSSENTSDKHDVSLIKSAKEIEISSHVPDVTQEAPDSKSPEHVPSPPEVVPGETAEPRSHNDDAILPSQERTKQEDENIVPDNGQSLSSNVKCATTTTDQDVDTNSFGQERKGTSEEIKIVPNLQVKRELSEDENDYIEIPTEAQLALRSAPSPSAPQNEPNSEVEDSDEEVPMATTSQSSAAAESQTVMNAYRVQELLSMDRDLVTEADRLQKQRGKLERQTATLNDQITAEAQELLRLFGMPYVVSPQEAEAQCAELDLSGQTHGTITDDSDIWLFGGTKVYKNMFNQGKYVEFFNINSIKSQLMLERESLISLAYLCGSDYTPGVPSVGPVTGLELLAEFPAPNGLERLQRLKAWWNQAQKSRKPPMSETKVKSKLRKLKLKPGFPSKAVWSAYTKPAVEQDKDKFTWEKPDLDLLRAYALEKFGWSQNKADEALLPVMKRLSEHTFQRHITSFFSVDFEPKKPKSKRVKNVLDRMQGKEVAVPMSTVKEKPRSANNTQRKRLRETSVEAQTTGRKPVKLPKQDNSGEGESSPVKTSARGRGQRKKGEPRPRNQPVKNSRVSSGSEEEEKPAPKSPGQGQSGQGQQQHTRGRGQGQRGRGQSQRGRPKRGRGVVLAQKQRGGSFKILHCPNKQNVVEEVNLSESSSSDED